MRVQTEIPGKGQRWALTSSQHSCHVTSHEEASPQLAGTLSRGQTKQPRSAIAGLWAANQDSIISGRLWTHLWDGPYQTDCGSLRPWPETGTKNSFIGSRFIPPQAEMRFSSKTKHNTHTGVQLLASACCARITPAPAVHVSMFKKRSCCHRVTAHALGFRLATQLWQIFGWGWVTDD